VTDYVTCTTVIGGNNIFAVTPIEVAGINVRSGDSIHNKERSIAALAIIAVLIVIGVVVIMRKRKQRKR